MRSSSILFTAFITCTACQLSASTIAYYRFESGNFLSDSSGNGAHLTEAGTPAQVSLPETGRGSSFSKIIPQTSTANGSTSSIFSTDRFGEASNGSVQVTSDFTAEAYISMATTTSGTQYIVSDWEYTEGNKRGFAFGVAGTSGVGGGSAGALFLLLSEDGSSTGVFQTGITISKDIDYYVGISFDESNTSSGITFYAQDLTNNEALLSSSIGHNIASLNNATALFRIGAMNNSTSPFQGFIDEVRISDTPLSQTQLLAVPEPSAYALIAGALSVITLLRRRCS